MWPLQVEDEKEEECGKTAKPDILNITTWIKRGKESRKVAEKTAEDVAAPDMLKELNVSSTSDNGDIRVFIHRQQ